MGIVDFILNLAGLLLWLNWRSLKFDPLQKRTPVTLVGTLRPAVQKKFRRWHLLAAIGALIILRALLYWQIGSAIHWTGNLDLGVIALSFRSDWFWRILLFSFLSFGLMLWTFYLWLLLLSILAKPQPVHRFVQIQLGEVDHWSRRTKIFLPFVCSAIAWWVASWLFDWLQIIPASVSPW
ncbi:MAG TPA: hypothetical protein VHG89_05095, partial [Verrucomicrobiae bacterium]|nr:hypothetical protein [Verrucomicrobiae bacterium]